MAKTSEAEVKKSFFALVNLTPREIEAWLETEHSKSVGFDSGDGESVGRKSGRRIIAILRKKRAADADDIAHMRKVVGFIRRHLAQPPGRNVETSRWRYSLMNWGHDPLKPSDSDMPWR